MSVLFPVISDGRIDQESVVSAQCLVEVIRKTGRVAFLYKFPSNCRKRGRGGVCVVSCLLYGQGGVEFVQCPARRTVEELSS